jgi:hypothetical protein
VVRIVAVLLAASAAGVLNPDAAAKGPIESIRVCGPARCATVRERAFLDELESRLRETPSPRASAPLPSAYYTLRDSEGRLFGYFMPSTGSLGWSWGGGGVGAWSWMRLSRAAAEALGQRVAPFERPKLVALRVAGRPVRNLDGYETLLGPLARAAIPRAAGARWITLSFHWPAQNPWSRPDVPIQYDPDERVLFRANDWFRVPDPLADRVEVDAGLRAAPKRNSRVELAAGAALAVVALALLLLTRAPASARV